MSDPLSDEVTGTDGNCMMRIFIVFNLAKHYYSSYIRKNEMAAACDAYGGEEMCIHIFDGETYEKQCTSQTWT